MKTKLSTLKDFIATYKVEIAAAVGTVIIVGACTYFDMNRGRVKITPEQWEEINTRKGAFTMRIGNEDIQFINPK